MSNSTKPTLFSDTPVKTVKILSAAKSSTIKPKASKYLNIIAMLACVFALAITVFNFFN